MAIPEQIRKQSEEVQRLYEELNGDVKEEVSNEAPSEPEPEQPTNASEQQESAEVQPTEKQDAAASDGKPGEDYAQKYRTLQGMYNKEVPRLRAHNKELGERLAKMESLLATLNQQQTQQQQQEPTPQQRLVSEKEVEEYGEDTVDLLRRVSREEYLPYLQKLASLEDTLSKLQSSVVPQVESVIQTQTRTAEERFWESLEHLVPDWREVNANQDFHTWLLEYDPLIGDTRQSLLEQAQGSLDHNRVAQFFNTWKSFYQGSAGKAEPNPSQSELEKQIAPGKARSAKTPTGSEAQTYTPEDIKKFFDDVRKGKYKNREDERNRIERDIFAAQQQGRIVVNA